MQSASENRRWRERREKERKPLRGDEEWILMRDSKYIGATRGKEGKGKTPWSRCDRTGRVSARRVVFTRHQTVTFPPTRHSGFSEPHIGIAEQNGREEIPVERQAYRQTDKVSPARECR